MPRSGGGLRFTDEDVRGLVGPIPLGNWGEALLYSDAPDGYSSLMIIPLDLLVNDENNNYELTNASVRRAYQITMTGDEELDENNGKVVSTAIRQILTKKVQYQLEE